MPKVLNLDALVEARVVRLGGKDYEVKELSAKQNLQAIAKLAGIAEMADGRTVEAQEQIAERLVEVAAMFLPTVDRAELERLTFVQLNELVSFLLGVEMPKGGAGQGPLAENVGIADMA